MLFLRKALGDAPFRRIWRNALSSLQDLIFHDVLLRQEFTTLGAAQLRVDFEAIQGTIERCIKVGDESILGMPKLREAIALLNIPVEAEDGRMPLKEISEAIFADGQRTQDMLESLGMKHLTNGEARTVLAKRLEASTE